MHKRSFNIKYLPPITLENFKKDSWKEYQTNNVTLIKKNDGYYLIKDVDKELKITENFFEFLVADKISEVYKTIYDIPLSGNLNIIIEETKDNNLINRIAIVYFKTLKDSQDFEIPKFFGEEIFEENRKIDYIEINSNDIILLVAKLKELDINLETKNQLLELYNKVINSSHDNGKPIAISINKNSEIASLLGYNEKQVTKKMI